MDEIPPLFIAGCGRSGTTYLRTILAAHPDVFIPNESLFIADYLRHAHALPPRWLHWLYYNEPQLLTWYDGPQEPITDIAETIRRCHEYQAVAQGSRLWGQKTPRFVRYMPEFERAFPGCRWMLIYRDPRAVVASHLKSLRHTYSVTAASRRWVRDNQPIVRFLREGQTPENVMLVKYEDLVRDYDAHLEKLFRFAGLTPLSREEVSSRGRAWEYRGTGFSVQKNNLRDGLDPQPKNIDAWKKQLTERQVRAIETICSAEMKLLGYNSLAPGEAAPDRPLEAAHQAAERFKDIGIVYQYVKAWPRYPLHTVMRKLAIKASSGGIFHSRSR